MKFLYAVSLLFLGIQSAEAKLLSTSTQEVVVKIETATLELAAQCRRPQFEDDTFTPFFSEASYKEAKKYIDNGFSMKLLDKTCGTNGSGPELSEDTFEKVTVYFVDGTTPRESLETYIETIWNAKN